MAFMVARYGDYVLLKPPFKSGTLAAVAGRPAGPAGRRRRAAARRPQAPRPGAARAADRGGARQGRAHCWHRASPRAKRGAVHASQARESAALRAVGMTARPSMLEFLLALLTTATVAALLVPLLRPRARRDRPARQRHRRLSRPARRGRARARGGHAARRRRRRRPHRDRAPPARRRRAGSALGARHSEWRVMAPLPHAGLCLADPPLRPRPLPPDRPARPPRRALHRPPRRAAVVRRPAAPTLAETIAAAARPARRRAGRSRRPVGAGRGADLRGRRRGDPARRRTPSAARWTRTRTIRARCSISACTRRRAATRKAALERWRALEQRSPPQAPWLPALRAEMQRVARAAGLPAPQSPTPPASPERPSPAPRHAQPDPGPDAGDAGPDARRAPAGDPRHGRGPRRAAARRAAGQARGPRRLAAAGQRAQGAGRERQGRRGLRQGRRDRRRLRRRSSPTGPRRRSA